VVETGNGGADADADIIVRFLHKRDKLEKINSAAAGAMAAPAGFQGSIKGSDECFRRALFACAGKHKDSLCLRCPGGCASGSYTV
jgi:hypothetical protein